MEMLILHWFLLSFLRSRSENIVFALVGGYIICLQHTNILSDGAHARHWCPELGQLEARCVHAPWTASKDELAAAGVALGRSYPERMVDLERSADRNRARWERARRATPGGRDVGTCER